MIWWGLIPNVLAHYGIFPEKTVLSTYAGSVSGDVEGSLLSTARFQLTTVTGDVSCNIASLNGVLYVPEREGKRIKRISNGVATRWATNVGDIGGIAVNASGFGFITCPSENTVKMIYPNGTAVIIAGSGTPLTTDGVGVAADFNTPTGIVLDSNNNLYVTDMNGYAIRRIQSNTWVVTTLAGGSYGNVDGTGLAASFQRPTCLTIDSSNVIYVTDGVDSRIRRITSSGVVTTYSGTFRGYKDGFSMFTRFNSPGGIVVDSNGFLYVADTLNHLIRMISPDRQVKSIVGTGSSGSFDGAGNNALLAKPFGLGFVNNSLVVMFQGSDLVKRVTLPTVGGKCDPFIPNISPTLNCQVGAFTNATRVYVSATGVSGSTFSSITSATFGMGNISLNLFSLGFRFNELSGISSISNGATNYNYQAAFYLQTVEVGGSQSIDYTAPILVYDRKPSNVPAFSSAYCHNVAVTTFAGQEAGGDQSGSTSTSSFRLTNGVDGVRNIIVDANGIAYVPDRYNNKIKRIFNGTVSEWLIGVSDPSSIAIARDGGFYITSAQSNRIGRIGVDKQISYFIGSGLTGFSNAAAASSSFNNSIMVAVDRYGVLYISDSGNNVIRRTSPDLASVETFVGSGAFSALDGTGTAATFASPDSIAFDSQGNLYISDSRNHRIRRVSSGGVVTTLTGLTAGFADGSLSVARFNNPDGIAIDSNDIIYVADQGNNRIRMILPHGEVRTIAGGSTSGNVNSVGCNALLNSPIGVSVGGDGNLYVTSLGNNQIKRLSILPLFTRTSTISGSNQANLEGYISNAQFNNPQGLGFDADGNLYVAETSSHRIREINTFGYALNYAGKGTASSTDAQSVNATFYSPKFLFVHPNGTVFVLDSGTSKIRRIAPDGMVSTLPGTFSNARDMKLASDGNIYLIDSTGALKRITSTATSSTLFTFNQTTCPDPQSLAISPDGNINVFSSSPWYCTVNATGAYISRTEFDCEVCGGHACTSALSLSSGFICASSIDHTITLLSSSGRCSLIAGSCNNPGSADGSLSTSTLNAPSAMTLDGFGNLYVSENGNDRIRRIAMGNIICDYTFVADAPTLACEYFGTEPAVIALSSSSSINGLQFGGRNNTVTGPGKFRMDVSKVGYFLTYVNATSYRLNTNTSTGFLANRNLFVAAVGSSISFSPPVRVVDPSPAVQPRKTIVTSSPTRYSYRYLHWYVEDVFNVAASNYVQASNFYLYLNGSPLNISDAIAINPGGGFVLTGPDKLLDNAPSKWCASNGVNRSVFFDFLSLKHFDSYSWMTADDQPSRDPKNWLLFGSNDNSTWDLLSSVTGYTSMNSQARQKTQPIFYLNNVFKSVKDASGNTYVIDAARVAIERTTSAGVRTTFAGSTSEVAGMTDATGTNARFQAITGIAIDASNNIYVSEGAPNNRIRKILADGTVSTHLSGLGNPTDIVYSPLGYLLVSEGNNNRILRVNLDSTFIVYGGSGAATCTPSTKAITASFIQPQSLYVDIIGNLYLTSSCKSVDIIYANASYAIIAGTRISGFKDGRGDSSLFSDSLTSLNMAIPGNLTVYDSGNAKMRSISIDGYDKYVSPNVVYVRNSLVDGSGTRLSPRNNVASALTTAPDNSIIRFCNGDIYTLPVAGITIPNSITIDSYDCIGDDTTPPTLTQATPISIQPTIITKNGVTVWSFDLTSVVTAGKDVGALWINNKRYVLARYPNLKDPLSLIGGDPSEYEFRRQHINSTAFVPSLSFKNLGEYWLGARIRYKNGGNYAMSRLKSFNSNTFILDGAIFTDASLNGFYLENIEGELDFPGEFFYNRTTNTLFIVPMANEEWKPPTRMDQGLWLLYANGYATPLVTTAPRDWTNFGATFGLKFSKYSQLRTVNFDKSFFGISSLNDLRVENVSMTRITDESIRIATGSNMTVVANSYFEWIDGSAIIITNPGTSLGVYNSIFRNMQMYASYMYPVTIYQTDHTKTVIVDNSLFENVGGSAVTLFSVNNFFRNNVFRNVSLSLSRMAIGLNNPQSDLSCLIWGIGASPCSSVIGPGSQLVISNNLFEESCNNLVGTISYGYTIINVLVLTFPNAQVIGNTFVTKQRFNCFLQSPSGITNRQVQIYNSMTLSRNAFIETTVLIGYQNVVFYMNDFLPFNTLGETNHISTQASYKTVARGNLFCNNQSTYTSSNTLMQGNTIITDGNCYPSNVAYVSNSTVPPTAHLIHERGIGATPASSGSLEQISTLSNRTVYIPRGETYTRNSIQLSTIFSSNLTWTPMIGVDGSNTSFPVFTEATPFSSSPNVLTINGQSVWRFNLTQTNQIEAVWVDGVEYQVARYPNKDSLFGRPSSSNFEYVRARLNATSFMPDVSLKNRSSYWVGAKIQIRLLNETWTTATIMNYSDGTFTLDREIFDLSKTVFRASIQADDQSECALAYRKTGGWKVSVWNTQQSLNSLITGDKSFFSCFVLNTWSIGGAISNIYINNTLIDSIPNSKNNFYVTNITQANANWYNGLDWSPTADWVFNFSKSGEGMFLYPTWNSNITANYIRRELSFPTPRLEYYIENLLSELDAPGEYYADSNYLYIRPINSVWSPPITTSQGVWYTTRTKYKSTPMGWTDGGQVSISGLRFDKMSNGLSLSPASLSITNSMFSNIKATSLMVKGGTINLSSTTFTNVSNHGIFITDATSATLNTLTLKNIGQVDTSRKRFLLGTSNLTEAIGIYVDADSVFISTSTIESIGGSVLQSNAKQGLLDRVFISDTNTFIQDTPIKLSGNWTIVDNTLQGFNTPIHPRDDGVVTAMTVQGQTLVIQRNRLLSSSFNLSQVQITGSCDISGNVFTNIKLVLDSKNATINSNRFIPTDTNALGVPTGIEPTTSSLITSLSNNTFCNKRSSMLALSNLAISTTDNLINTNGSCTGLTLLCLPLTAGIEPTVNCTIKPFQIPGLYNIYMSPTNNFNDTKLLMNTTSLNVAVPFVTLGYDFTLATQDATGNTYYLKGPSSYQSANGFKSFYMFASTADNAVNFSLPIALSDPTLSVTCSIQQIIPGSTTAIPCTAITNHQRSQINYHLSSGTTLNDILLSNAPADYNNSVLTQYPYLSKYNFTRSNWVWYMNTGAPTKELSNVVYVVARTKDGLAYGFSSPITIVPPTLNVTCQDRISPFGSDLIACSVTSSTTVSQVRLYLSFTNDISQAVTGSTTVLLSYPSSLIRKGTINYRYKATPMPGFSFTRNGLLGTLLNGATVLNTSVSTLYMYAQTTDGFTGAFSNPMQLEQPSIQINCLPLILYPGGSDQVNCTVSSNSTSSTVRLYLSPSTSISDVFWNSSTSPSSLGSISLNYRTLGASLTKSATLWSMTNNISTALTTKLHIYAVTTDGLASAFSSQIQFQAPTISVACSTVEVYPGGSDTVSCTTSSSQTFSKVRLYLATSNTIGSVLYAHPGADVNIGATSISVTGLGYVFSKGAQWSVSSNLLSPITLPQFYIYAETVDGYPGAFSSAITVKSPNISLVCSSPGFYLDNPGCVSCTISSTTTLSKSKLYLSTSNSSTLDGVYLNQPSPDYNLGSLCFNMTAIGYNFTLTDDLWTLSGGGRSSLVGSTLYIYARTTDGFNEAFSAPITVLSRTFSVSCSTSVLYLGYSDVISCTSSSPNATLSNVRYYLSPVLNRSEVILSFPTTAQPIGSTVLNYTALGFTLSKVNNQFRLSNTGYLRNITTLYVYAQTVDGVMKAFSGAVSISDPTITLSCTTSIICPSDADMIACSVTTSTTYSRVQLYVASNTTTEGVFMEKPTVASNFGAMSYSLKSNSFYFNRSSTWTITTGASSRSLTALYIYARTVDGYATAFSSPIAIEFPSLNISCSITSFDPINPTTFVCLTTSFHNLVQVDLFLSTTPNMTGAFTNETFRQTLGSNTILSGNYFTTTAFDYGWVIQSATNSRNLSNSIFIGARTLDGFTTSFSAAIPVTSYTAGLVCTTGNIILGTTRSITCTGSLTPSKLGVYYEYHLSTSNTVDGVLLSPSPMITQMGIVSFDFDAAGYGVIYDTNGWLLVNGNTERPFNNLYVYIKVINTTFVAFSDPITVQMAPATPISKYRIAGSTADDVDDVGTFAAFNAPSGLALGDGGVYVGADSNKLRFLTFSGVASTVAGNSYPGASNNLNPLLATFRKVKKLASDDERVFIADTGNYRIRTFKDQVGLLAGSVKGYLDGVGSSAQFSDITGLVVVNGTVFVSDGGNHRIRKVTMEGVVTTVAGSVQGDQDGVGVAARFNSPAGLDYDDMGNIYVADKNNHKIKRISPNGQVTTFAGSGIQGNLNGYRLRARFTSPTAVAVDSKGCLYITESNGIRNLTSGYVTTVSTDYAAPEALVLDVDDSLIVADMATNSIYRLQTYNVSIQTMSCTGSYTIGSTNGISCSYATDPPNQVVKFYLSTSSNSSGIVYTIPLTYPEGAFKLNVLDSGYTFDKQFNQYYLIGKDSKPIGNEIYVVGMTMTGDRVFSSAVTLYEPSITLTCDANQVVTMTNLFISCVLDSTSPSPVTIAVSNSTSKANILRGKLDTFLNGEILIDLVFLGYTLDDSTNSWYIKNETDSLYINSGLYLYASTVDQLMSTFSSPVKVNFLKPTTPPLPQVAMAPAPSSSPSPAKKAESNAESGLTNLHYAIIGTGGFIAAVSIFVFVRARQNSIRKKVKPVKMKKVVPTLPQVQFPPGGGMDPGYLGMVPGPETEEVDFLEIPME